MGIQIFSKFATCCNGCTVELYGSYPNAYPELLNLTDTTKNTKCKEPERGPDKLHILSLYVAQEASNEECTLSIRT